MSARPISTQQIRNEFPGRPRGSTGTSRARRRAGCGARRVARGPLLLTTGTASRRP
jgi:hypothetical protein